MAQGMNTLDYAVLAVSNAAAGVGLAGSTPAMPAAAKRAFITCETDAVRWRADGTAPTDTEGHVLAANDSISFTGANYRQLLENILFIRKTGDAALKITYFD